ncbi:hypothetical protein A8B78_00195 [Jannaschia sp. EhC01]|nr:hypothetical protein A8B78_00195 [Jannaschia sp. EhC01]
MKCVVVQPMDQAGLDVLSAGGVEPLPAPSTEMADLAPLLARADAAITRNWGFPSNALAAAPRLKVVGVHGTGTDRVAKSALSARGVKLVSTPGANAQSVAEHALGLMLAVARGIADGHQAMQAADFAFRERFRGVELSGRCLGVWGWGHVSRRFASLAQALGMDVLVYSHHADRAELAAKGCRSASTLEGFLGQSDVVSLHALPTGSPILGAAELALMRKDAIVINTARGALVDDAALVTALKEGRLFGAGLDVFTEEPPKGNSPLIGCPGLLMTPHIGGSTAAALRRTAVEVAQEVLVALGGQGR